MQKRTVPAASLRRERPGLADSSSILRLPGVAYRCDIAPPPGRSNRISDGPQPSATILHTPSAPTSKEWQIRLRHRGVDISAPAGTPIRATADGVVKSADIESGYGREVILDNGHGVETCYGHMSGFAVMAGQSVVRGQVIGYVGRTGRTTGANLHYEVRIHNTPVNPHKYMRDTLAGMGSLAGS